MTGNWATQADCIDPALSVSQLNLDEADVFVGLALRAIGISDTEADTITRPNATLTVIAATIAKSYAALEGSMGENSLLIDKARQYKKNAEDMAKQLNRSALGLSEPSGYGFGSFTLGRN